MGRALAALVAVAISRLVVFVVQEASAAGLDTAYVTPGATNTFPYAAHRSLHVINGSGGSINVTLLAQKACNQGTLHDRVVAVPASQDRLIGDIGTQYVDANGYVHASFSATTTITAAVLES